MPGDDPRGALARAATARGLSYAALSEAIRRNPAYVQQYVARGSPRVLAEADRRVLAAMLGLDERALGGPAATPAPFALPRLDVRASAGPGADAGTEAVLGIDSVDPALARALRLRPGRAGLIAVAGDSMEPELHDGDQLVVNLDDRAPGPRGRVYVVRIEGALLVKRVRIGTGGPIASSDNPLAPPLPPGEVEVVGRVVWRMGAPR